MKIYTPQFEEAQKALEELNINIKKSTSDLKGDLKTLNEILQEITSKLEEFT